MRFILILAGVSVWWGCTQRNEYPISDTELEPTYYITLLKEVSEKLERTDGKNRVDLLYKKLFISQQLRWPEDLSKEIRFLMENEGLDYELYQYASDFYESNHHYEKLLNLVSKWVSEHQLTSHDLRAQIVALKGLGRENEARHLLWDFLQRGNQKDDLKFIAEQYLDFEDTTRAIYAYSRLARNHPQELVLRDVYIPLLIETGYPDRARDLLAQQSMLTEDPESQALMARILFDLGEPYQAIDILRHHNNSRAYLQIARWFKSLNRWDSAIHYTDLVIARDSSRQALLTKGDIYEERGWLNSAYRTFEMLVRRDSTDSIAHNKTEIVGRKIAYLRRKREAEQEIPILEVPTKKLIENE